MSERSEEPITPADEARAAAEEAAAIGGPDPYADLDPAERPVAEGGGGVAEGWEQAEEALTRQATHDDAEGHPIEDAFAPEVETDRSGAAYGDPDEYGEHDDDEPEPGER